MATAGKLRSIGRSLRSSGANYKPPASSSGLRRHGDLASLVRVAGNACGPDSRDHTSRQPVQALVEALHPIALRPREVAFKLLEQFGSLSRIANATDEELKLCETEGEAWASRFIAARSLLFAGMYDQVIRTNLKDTREPLYRYLIMTIGGLQQERLLAFLLDHDGMVLSEQIIAEGEAGAVKIPMRLIVGRALTFGATGIVLAHNHPSGSAEPSVADTENTQRLDRAMRELGMHVFDHIIVGRGKVVSLRDRGRI